MSPTAMFPEGITSRSELRGVVKISLQSATEIARITPPAGTGCRRTSRNEIRGRRSRRYVVWLSLEAGDDGRHHNLLRGLVIRGLAPSHAHFSVSEYGAGCGGASQLVTSMLLC